MKTESTGLFSRIGSNPFMAILVVCFLGLLAVVALILFKLRLYAEQDQNLQSIIADLRASSFELSSLARDATNGDKQAFDRLGTVVGNMDESWSSLKNADTETRAALATEMTSYEGVWSRMRLNAESIINNKAPILLMHDVARNLNNTLPKLQSENDNVVDILLDNDARAEQVSRAQRQTWFAERIGRNVDKMLRGGLDVEKAADEFNKDANLFTKVISGMIDGDVAMGIRAVRDSEARESLTEMRELFDFVSTQVNEIFNVSDELALARDATTNILDGSPLLQQRLVSLTNELAALPAKRKYNEFALMVVGALALVCLLVIFWQLNVSTKKRLRETAETNERNQNAILRLLDELADLADGDLTTTATVTEDFTGAIADSINYTIDQLRVLVSNINDTSVEVSSAAQETQQTALHLAEASEHQAQEIAGASAAVNEMAVTIDQVSANAAESAGVAERSVSIASNGAKVVQNTIHGMDTIREQIQDTSKRIKRLGESSQEIGDIVSLINDIADQTNILALNAAIQASMAGDAGRGFAVVADEVQRLAERSAAATKQIEALVKTIQNDTNEAVISMETTTSEVVRGARLAQDAGVALEEIETVSANLAELIQNISNAARQQAASAGHISNTMNVIQEITSQTSAGTTATATAIGTLANMAVDLRESVAGFKLPEEMVTYTPEQIADMNEAAGFSENEDLVLGQDVPSDERSVSLQNDDGEIETLTLDDEAEGDMSLSENNEDEALLDLSLDDAIDEFDGEDDDHSDDDRARA